MRAGELIHPDERTWDMVHIQSLFGESLVERICAMIISSNRGPDTRVWGSSCCSRVGRWDMYHSYNGDPLQSIEGS